MTLLRLGVCTVFTLIAYLVWALLCPTTFTLFNHLGWRTRGLIFLLFSLMDLGWRLGDRAAKALTKEFNR